MKNPYFVKILTSFAFYAAFLIVFLTTPAFAADSDLDTTFDGDGKVTTNNFYEEGGRDVVIQPDGKIVVVGGKTSTFNVQNFAAVRYNANGSLDSTFGAGGIYVLPTLIGSQVAAGKAAAVDLQPDGKILLAGTAGTNSSSNQIFLIIRLNTNGTLDTTFGSGGRVIKDIGKPNSYGGLSAMVFDAARSKIYLGGTTDISSDGGTYAYTIMRFNADGTTDTTFNGTGTQAFPVAESRPLATGINDIALQADGKIIAVGKTQYSIPNTPSIESFGTARINVDGTLDSSFGTNGIIITDFTYTDTGTTFYQNAAASTVSITPDGKIFVGGLGGSGSGGVIRNFYFAAQFNSNGSYDSSFGTNGKIRAEAIMITDSVITQSGKIIVIGEKNANFGVARLNANGTIDTTFGTGGFVQTGFSTGGTEYPLAVALQTDGKIIAAGGSKNPNTSGPGMDYQLVSRYTGTPVVTAPRGTWDGGGATNNWSDAANWGGDTVPTSTDNVIFDATSAKSAVVDTTFTVASVSINSGYSGTISQNSVLTVTNAFTQSAGTFQGTAANANFGTLILNAGSNFAAPSGTLSVTSQTAYEVFNYNGGTFNANNGTFSVDGRSDLNYFRYQTPTFNNLVVNKPLTILNASIVVNGSLTLNAILSNSSVTVNGDVTFASDYTSGSAVLNFIGTATRTSTLSGTTIGNPITVNNPNVTVTTSAASGNIVWNQKVTLQAGTLRQSAANYTFSASGNFNAPGFEVSGGTFQGSAGNAVFNTTIGISSGNLNGGTGELGTNAAFCPAFPQANYYFQQSGGTFNGGAGNARFCDLRRTGGAFTAPSGNLTILSYGDFAGGTFSANNGTLVAENNVSINAPGFTLNNVTLLGANGHGFTGTPKPQINGTFNLAEGQFSNGDVAANGDIIYGASFTGGGGRLFLEGITTRTINLPARNILLGMTLDNPNVTVTTSGAGASIFVNFVEVKRGLLQQGNAVLNFGGNDLRVSGGTFQGNTFDLNVSGIAVSGGAFQGGAGLVNVAGTINTSGGTFASGGDVNLSTYTQTGGTFNAPNGLMTVVADWTHTAGAFNGGGGTVKFTGYNTFNCINFISLDVPTTETFNNLIIANQFCNRRGIAAGDTLIVNGDFRIAYGTIQGGRIRPLGTTTIDATNNGYVGSSIVEYLAPNRNFVINNPSSVVNMFPVEMNAANSTLTSSGGGQINFAGMTLTDGTLNQANAIWDFTAYPGYLQSGGIFNGSAAQLNITNGINGNLLTGGTFNGGTGLINGGWGQTGGTFSTVGDMNVAALTLTGGTFNAPLGTLDLYNGFSHTGGGTFNARTGTIRTSIRAGVYQAGFDVNSTEIFNNLQFNGTNNNANHGIAAGDTLIVNGTLNFNGRGANGGSIVANGNVIYTNFGGYQNASTIVKFQDTATRTINFSNDCTSYFQPTLVDNPNITINSGCNDANAFLTWTSLDLRQGTVNAGNARSGFTGSFAQSGGTFNAGNNAINPSTTVSGDFTLSGGDFNAAPFTSFGGNYTHISGGNFNYGTGTAIFSGIGGTIDVNGSENFNNISFQQGSTGTTKTIAAGDTIIANGNVNFLVGYVSGGTIDAKKNVSVGGGNAFSGGSTALNFTGADDQIYTNSGGISTSGTWTVNKPNSAPLAETGFAAAAPTNLLISGNIGNNGSATLVPLNITAGNVVQTGNYNHALASLTLTPAASFINEFGGAMTLGGDVTNNGVIKLNANGTGCQADSILLRSTNAAQRNWNGSGYFLLTDVDVSGQSGTPLITVYSGTNSGNNGANWVFNGSCFAPTAASVSVSGRVLSANGRGIANVAVVLTDTQGASRVAVSNAFGYYVFNEVAAGQTVILAPQARKYKFSGQTQILNLSDSLTGINFTADSRP